MGLFKSSKDTTEQPFESTTTQALPPYIEQGAQDILGFGRDIASEPYQPYPGPRVAPLSGNEQFAVSLGDQYTGAGRGGLSSSNQMIGQAGQRFPDVDIASYMNPYISNVLEPTAREIYEGADRERNRLDAFAVSRGAFGGERQGLENVELQERTLQSISDLYGQGFGQAFDTGAGIWGTEQDRAANLAGIQSRNAALESDLATADLQRLMATGGLERGVEQQSLDTAYGDFLTQRDYPLRNLDVMLRSIGGVPYPTSSFSTGFNTNTQQSADPYSQAIGLGLTAASIYSSEDYKENKRALDPEDALDAIVNMRVEGWQYKPEVAEAINDNRSHIGPYAEEFNEKLGLEPSDRIQITDAIGALIASVQALEARDRPNSDYISDIVLKAA